VVENKGAEVVMGIWDRRYKLRADGPETEIKS
jgi:hypothetical protein